jgi:hypothetical protein
MAEEQAKQETNNSSFPHASADFFFRLFFDLQNGSNMFLRNVGALFKLHSVTTQKILLFIVIAVRASNQTYCHVVCVSIDGVWIGE